MGKGATHVFGLLLAAQRSAGLLLHSEQPELFLPPKEPTIADPNCPFYQQCGEDCLGSPLMRKQMSPEAKMRLEWLASERPVVMASFSLLSDLSPDIALACMYNFTVHVFDPRPLAPRHMEQIQLSVGSMETPHPFMAPEHETCQEGCEGYWKTVAHSKVSGDHFVHHDIAVGRGSGSQITMYENPGGGYMLDGRKGMKGGNNVTLPTLSVLEALRAAGLPRIDVVRIDSDGLEDTILEQVAALPDEMKPEVIFAQLPSFYEWTCKGEREECRGWKKRSKAVVQGVKEQGYYWQLYHKMDQIFLRKRADDQQ